LSIFGGLDGNAYAGIESPCAADLLPSWFKFRLFLQWHKELPGERFDRRSLGFLLSSTPLLNCPPKRLGGRPKAYRYLQPTGVTRAGQWNFAPSTLHKLTPSTNHSSCPLPL